jgi:ABC-type Fe3+/spermidine/putrescine transport system ATPase subunit
MEVADRIVVMNRGRIEQIGRAADLYERPASRFVAQFIGRMNVVRDAHGNRIAGVRPEHIEIVEGVADGPEHRRGRVQRCAFLGSVTRVTLRIGEDAVVVEVRGRREDLVAGSEVTIRIPGEALLRLTDAPA